MAIISYISFITLTFCILCQINLSSALHLYRYKTHPLSLQQQDGRFAFFNEYFRQKYPVNQQRESSYNPVVYIDSTVAEEPISRLHGLKRNAHQSIPGNKRMLCFFHAVNCFG